MVKILAQTIYLRTRVKTTIKVAYNMEIVKILKLTKTYALNLASDYTQI